MSNISAFQEMQLIAESIAESNLFGIKTAAQALALMAIAQAEGRPAALAARDYHIILGRPTLKADAMLSRFHQAGGSVDWHTYSAELADATFTCPKGKTLRISWSIDDAKKAGLYKNDSGWVKYPRAMLRARLISEAIRTILPEVICGFYTPEEEADLQEIDITPKENSKLVDIIEKAKSASKKLNKPEKGKEGKEEPIYIQNIKQLVLTHGIPADTVNAWLEKEQKQSISELSEEFVLYLTNGINEKYGDVENANIN